VGGGGSVRFGRFRVLFGDETSVRILINENAKMTPGKMAAQAVHAALLASDRAAVGRLA